MSAAPVVVVGGGPAGLAAALELRRRGVARRARARARGRRRRDPAPRAAPGLRAARPAPPAVRARATRAATPSSRRAAGAELRTETMVTGWSPGGPLELTGPRGREHARAGRRGARHRLPRAPALGAARARLAARGRDDHRHAPAARVPQGPDAGRAGARRRRRARELLRARSRSRTAERERWAWSPSCRATSRWRCSGRAPPCASGLRSGRAPRVSAIHGRAARGGGGAHRPRQRRRTRASRATPSSSRADWIPDHELAVMAGLDDGPGHPRPGRGRGAAHVDARASSPPATCCTAPRRPTWPRSAAATRPPRPPRSWTTVAPGRTFACRSRCEPPLRWIAPNVVVPGAGTPPRGRFALRSDELRAAPARGGRAGRPHALVWPPSAPRAGPLGRACRTHGLRRSIRPADR